MVVKRSCLRVAEAHQRRPCVQRPPNLIRPRHHHTVDSMAVRFVVALGSIMLRPCQPIFWIVLDTFPVRLSLVKKPV